MSSQPVLFEEHPVSSDRCVAVATLNAPSMLNALTQELLDMMTGQLQRWRDDPRIVMLVIQGAGERAFCAGGDVVTLYHWMREAPGQPCYPAEHFLVSEYRLHYVVHTFGKPVLAWGHGVAMGSGLGIFVGASHRVVTETARYAMPEVGIGLFPDAGATWFLPRMPNRIGLFLGLTGVMCNAGDALFVGLGNVFLSSLSKQDVLEALVTLSWNEDESRHHGQLTGVLDELAMSSQSTIPESPLRERAEVIDRLMAHERIEDVIAAVQRAAARDEWFVRSAKALEAGSPTSVELFREQHRRGLALRLKECFQLEAVLAIHGIRHPDFAEGVRARLVDKDMMPQWKPESIAEVNPDQIATYFTLPTDYAANPLVDL